MNSTISDLVTDCHNRRLVEIESFVTEVTKDLMKKLNTHQRTSLHLTFIYPKYNDLHDVISKLHIPCAARSPYDVCLWVLWGQPKSTAAAYRRSVRYFDTKPTRTERRRALREYSATTAAADRRPVCEHPAADTTANRNVVWECSATTTAEWRALR